MLAAVLNASSPARDAKALSRLPGKHSYSFWTGMNSCISLVANDPFKRNDVVNIRRADGSDLETYQEGEYTQLSSYRDKDRVFLLDIVDYEDITERMAKDMSFIIPLSTDIPLSPDVDYRFSLRYGRAECLTMHRVTDGKWAYYQMMLLVKPFRCKLVAEDSVYNDGGFSFSVDLTKEIEDFMKAYRASERRIA